MDTITGNKIPDDIRAKIEDKAAELYLINYTTGYGNRRDFRAGAEFGYLLSVDKDKEMESEAIAYQDTFIEELKKEIAEGRKEIERLNAELEKYIGAIDAMMKMSDELPELRKLKQSIKPI